MGGGGFGVFGHRVRSTLMTETTSGLLALLPGLLLRRLIGAETSIFVCWGWPDLQEDVPDT